MMFIILYYWKYIQLQLTHLDTFCTNQTKTTQKQKSITWYLPSSRKASTSPISIADAFSLPPLFVVPMDYFAKRQWIILMSYSEWVLQVRSLMSQSRPCSTLLIQWTCSRSWVIKTSLPYPWYAKFIKLRAYTDSQEDFLPCFMDKSFAVSYISLAINS